MSLAPPPRLPLDHTALFLDFDGTLVEIAERAEAVVVPPDLPGLLQRLADALGGALATVSGRPIDNIDRMLAPMRLTGAGAHGAELRVSGQSAVEQVGGPIPEALHVKLTGLLAEWKKRWSGIYAEDKRVAFAIHYRQAPDAEPIIAEALAALDLGNAWKVMRGHCVFEIKSALLSKASAVRSLMQRPPFLGRRPVFIGDDRTDLEGIAAAVELGGAGIAVGDLKADQAEWRLPHPASVRDWLRGLLAA
ncbi:MAG TPA: trehalose-phosphatase [Dongiaceae bacterium]|jgi:trehalose 6-phosphate phosphatase